MTNQEIIDYLKHVDLFSELSDEVLTKIAECAEYQTFAKDELLIDERNPNKHLYVIVSGHFSIFKIINPENKHEAKFGLLSPGDTVGELSFLDDKPRSASVKAIDDYCAAISIEKKELMELAPVNFYQQLGKKLSHYIRSGNQVIIHDLEKELAQNKKMENMGRFIVYVLLLISFYSLALRTFISLSAQPYINMFGSTIVIFVFTFFMFILIKHEHFTLSQCGVNLYRWKSNLAETFIFTFLFIIFATLLAWLIVHFFIKDEAFHFFNLRKIIRDYEPDALLFYPWLALGMLIYAIFANFQEFIARGVLQGNLQEFLISPRSAVIANIVTSGVFASMHAHLSTVLALLTFFPSLFWGWLYLRQGSLLGPVVSHILIGWWAIFGLGIQDFFR